MKRNRSIRLKATFLLLVFALNTMVGFACALGLDMGFNSHHEHQEATEIHIAGEKHEHHEAAEQHEEKNCCDPHKGGCCNDKVSKIALLDKTVPQPFHISTPNHSPIHRNYLTDILRTVSGITYSRSFLRSYHPPIPDICIAVRSFRI